VTDFLTIASLSLAVFAGLAVGWFILPFGMRRHSEARLARLCRAQKAIVLSYDDGPGPGLTLRLLDLLRNRGAATFFVLGRSAEANGTVVARAISEGHEVASHSFHHSNAWKVWPGHAARDLAAGIETVRGLGGNENLFRPPYGKLTLATLIDCLIRRQRFGWWTIDSKDPQNSGERRRIEDIIEEISDNGGGVVLMHDFDQAPVSDDGMSHADYVISLTERIIGFAEKNEYRLMKLGDVLHKTRRRAPG